MVLTCTCADIQFLEIGLQNPKIWSKRAIYHMLSAIFVTIATVKVKMIPEFNSWFILLLNQPEEIVNSNF